mmetsp:Transcript_38403/g.68867  ORF Transcript_38403/g.68867 Transcript_38403/m.68867 type:complete len:80 (-) Transcript_38403:1078-1317(-)
MPTAVKDAGTKQRAAKAVSPAPSKTPSNALFADASNITQAGTIAGCITAKASGSLTIAAGNAPRASHDAALRTPAVALP